MRTKFFTFLLLVISFALNAQDFAPVGAIWYYTVEQAFSWPGEQNYMTIEATKDTSINGQSCTELQSTMVFCDGTGSYVCWVYYSDSIVYFYDDSVGYFQILYNYKAKPNDSWTIIYPTNFSEKDTLLITVNSIGSMFINSIPVKVLNVNYSSVHQTTYCYSSKIAEKIGDISFLFNFHYYAIACDGDYLAGLRCYEDPVIGKYTTPNWTMPCDTIIHYGIDENNLTNKALVFPNPASNFIRVNNISGQLEYTLINIMGYVLKKGFVMPEGEIDISSFLDGIYLLELTDGNNKSYLRIIKN